MRQILVIQFRSNSVSLVQEQNCFKRGLEDEATMTFVSALDESIDWEHPADMLHEYDGLILGGSGEFDFDGGRDSEDPARMMSYIFKERLTPLITHVLRYDVPCLGVCYGHQIIGAIQGIAVVSDITQKKIGSFPITKTEAGVTDPLFSHLPSTFIAQYGHKDSLVAIPDGAVLLVHAENCRISALRYGRNVYTTQFHPELTHDDVRLRLLSSPGYLPEGVQVDSIVQPSLEASVLIPQFIHCCVSQEV